MADWKRAGVEAGVEAGLEAGVDFHESDRERDSGLAYCATPTSTAERIGTERAFENGAFENENGTDWSVQRSGHEGRRDS